MIPPCVPNFAKGFLSMGDGIHGPQTKFSQGYLLGGVSLLASLRRVSGLVG